MTDSLLYDEAVPERRRGTQVANGVLRIVADNASKMTFHGTNSYIVDTLDGVYIIDPGPAEDLAHIVAITKYLGRKPAGILVTHHHSDHFGAAPVLRERIGIPIYVSSAFPDSAFEPDALLEDG